MPGGLRGSRARIVGGVLALLLVASATVLLLTRTTSSDAPGAQAPTSEPASEVRPGPDSTGPPKSLDLEPATEITADEPNQVIEGADISGPVTVDAPGVVIRQSRINGSGPYGVRVLSGSVTISDTEISGFDNGIAGDNWSGYRLNIHSTKDDGVKLGSNVVLQDSWIHDLTPSADSHADGAQMQAGVENLVVRHNVIDLSTTSPANSAILLAPDLGPSSPGPVIIADNWLNGGNYTLYCVDGNDGQYVVGNISIDGNKFGRVHTYGPTSLNVPVEQSGNVWEDTNEPLTL